MELQVEIGGYTYVITKEPPIGIEVMGGVDVVFMIVYRQQLQRRHTMIFPDADSARLWISNKQQQSIK